MNQPSFDYAVLSDSVAAELKTLREEKQRLAENIKKAEERLTEISFREEKLAHFSDSLNDLLTIYPAQAGAESSSPLGMEKSSVAESSPDERENETNFAEDSASIDGEKLASSDSENDAAARNSVSIAEPEGEVDSSATTTGREFDKNEFFAAHSHLQNARQPIHILAEKLLDYVGKPLKLRDLTRYIEELGYRHQSQNFTNTVHTVLKNKRDRNGTFYFDPQQRMWELGHWRGSAEESESAAAINKSAEVGLQTDANSSESHTARQTNEKDSKTKTAAAKKKETSAKIILIKAGGRKL